MFCSDEAVCCSAPLDAPAKRGNDRACRVQWFPRATGCGYRSRRALAVLMCFAASRQRIRPSLGAGHAKSQLNHGDPGVGDEPLDVSQSGAGALDRPAARGQCEVRDLGCAATACQLQEQDFGARVRVVACGVKGPGKMKILTRVRSRRAMTTGSSHPSRRSQAWSDPCKSPVPGDIRIKEFVDRTIHTIRRGVPRGRRAAKAY